MKIVIVGSGYVGLVTGACLSDTGTHVVCVDIDAEKIARLEKGEMPIYEPGLEDLVLRNISKARLRFTTDLGDALIDADVAFIAVGTPPGDDGAADLTQVLGVAESIGAALAARPTDYLVVVTKSTVPVGTATRVAAALRDGAERARRPGIEPSQFDVASNPEFLKEGAAIEDFARPDRIVIGVESERAQAVLERLYRPFLLNARPVLFMDIASAEITKYAANAMLATRISFMNSIAMLCDAVGADVSLVRRGIGSDPRIGQSFLYAGPGYGGSCFPKDVRALHATAEGLGIDFGILREVEATNERQKSVPVAKVRDLLGRPTGSLAGIEIAVWGLAFKPNTDDIRDAPALTVIAELLEAGAGVRLYDPIATLPKGMFPSIQVCADPYAASAGADVLVLLTEWPEFRNVDPLLLQLRQPYIVDARNVLDTETLAESGYTTASIGRPLREPHVGTGFEP